MFIAPHSSASTWPKVIQRRDVDGHDPGHRLGDEREHAAGPGVEEQRLVGVDQELVEGEPGRRRDLGHEGRDAVDPVGDLVAGCGSMP